MHVMPFVIQLLKMPLVTHYKHLSKPDRRGVPQLFNSFRAAGLALELGWKKSRDLGAVSTGDLQQCTRPYVVHFTLAVYHHSFPFNVVSL